MGADTTGTAILTLTGLIFAVLLAIAAPLIAVDVDPSLRGNLLFVVVTMCALATMLMVAFAPAFYLAAKESTSKERSAVWLAAYQDELSRRHRSRGREARRWQRSH